jgi:hypothetical protein
MKGKEKQKESPKQSRLLFSRPSNDKAKKKSPNKKAPDASESLADMETADSQATELTDSMLTETQPNEEELYTQDAIDSPEILAELQVVGVRIYRASAEELTFESQDEWPPSPGRENSVPLVAEVEVN